MDKEIHFIVTCLNNMLRLINDLLINTTMSYSRRLQTENSIKELKDLIDKIESL